MPLAVLAIGVPAGVLGQETAQAIPLPLAAQYFAEARAASERDGGELWGAELYGPTLFVDRATRSVVANMADLDGILKPAGGAWAGALPPERNIANTAFQWAGRRWTMLIWPPPDHKSDGLAPLMHDSFHRIQPNLGLEASGGALLVREGGAVARIPVPAPTDLKARPVTGSGWNLQLDAGWQLIAGDREADVTVGEMTSGPLR